MTNNCNAPSRELMCLQPRNKTCHDSGTAHCIGLPTIQWPCEGWPRVDRFLIGFLLSEEGQQYVYQRVEILLEQGIVPETDAPTKLGVWFFNIGTFDKLDGYEKRNTVAVDEIWCEAWISQTPPTQKVFPDSLRWEIECEDWRYSCRAVGKAVRSLPWWTENRDEIRKLRRDQKKVAEILVA